MKAYLVGILMWCLAVAEAERKFSQKLLHGSDFDLGPYDAKVEIGVLPDRYPRMSAQDKKASYSVRRLLELLRGSFPTGIYEIPTLDPYINNNLSPFAVNVPFLSGEVDVQQIKVTGLQAFEIEQIEVRLNSIRTDFDFTVPLLHAIVHFQANLALGGLFPISFDGRLRIKLQNVKVAGAVSGLEEFYATKQHYTLSALQAHFHAENVKVSVDGLNLDKDVLETLQSVCTNVALEPIKKAVNHYVAKDILKQLNSIIQNFTVEQVNAYLLAR